MSSQSKVLGAIALCAATLFASSTGAQTTYRWVDKATGQTVYSDQPPPAGAQSIVKQSSASGASGGETQLPFATRQAAEKYPVTLYTAASCTDPCKQARELLNHRGVPFAEKMIDKEQDRAALGKLLGGDASVPTLTVGQQVFAGLEAAAWNNLLDLAGYPTSAPYGAKPSGAFAK